MEQQPQSLEARKWRAREAIKKEGGGEFGPIKVVRTIPATNLAAEETGYLKRSKKLLLVLDKHKETTICEYESIEAAVEDGWRPDV